MGGAAPAAGHAMTKADVDAWLDGFMPYALRRGDAAGAVVVVVRDGQVLTQRGFGYSDMAGRRPVDPETTLFKQASVSKLMTWTAVMQMVQQGRIDLDADINTYLDFRIPPRDGQPITMRHLMTHTAGFDEVQRGLNSYDQKDMPTLGEAIDIQDYVTEAEIPAGSPAVDETVAAFRARHDQEVTVTAILRAGIRATPFPDTALRAEDRLILTGAPDSLERVIAGDRLELEGSQRERPEGAEGEVGVIEAVIGTDCPLIGRSAGRLGLHERFGVNLIAVSRQGERLASRLGAIVLQAGDVIVLQGPLELLFERLGELGCLPLAQRTLRLGSARKGLLPVAILAAAMAATALGYVPVAVAFFAAAGLTILLGALPVREAYDHIEWPILVMLGALIPVSDSLRTTGASQIIGDWLGQLAATLPPWGAVALILAAAMAVTPFLNNAATVLVMAPIAATFAGQLGYRPEAFLMATAVGAGCDFLTPIGHQCNTLVMGPGGYRFGDYARLGAPLSVLVLVVGTPLILWVWPVF